jgi:beta-glucanase (GH16 family)
VPLQTLAGDVSGIVMRVPRAAALVLAVLGLFSASVTSSASSDESTLRSGVPATTTTSAAKGPDGPKGHWRLVFSDHFTGSTLDTANWSTCYFFGCTDKGNNELEMYQASQVTVHNGTVSLTVVPKRTHDKQYLSGMLSSHGKFSFRYGYAQIVAKLPRGRGLWSAFWTEPESGAWPPEIDIMENLAQSDSVSLYVHYDAANQFDSSTVYLPTASSAFHSYGVDWEPGSVTWYVDGFLWAHFAVSITQPEYLIADLAVNGTFPPNSSVQFPQSLVIRSIEVWQHPSRISAQTTH